MPVEYIPRTRELYAPLPPYRWADNRGKPVPWTPLERPLAECRVVLGSSAGIHRFDQKPFHFKDDTSIRLIPADTPAAALRVAHFGYPTEDAERDPNCVFPIDRLRELAADGVIGDLGPRAISWMGGIYSQRRVLRELAPAVLEAVRDQEADLFYIVPA
ncbi:MAG: hypothetical protein D6815_11945 [Candidatus Dadabacteria bacterium]|nr:MAG: hypothetical protein D6815_11945 [Candidatus Dadabacteria bacterium]